MAVKTPSHHIAPACIFIALLTLSLFLLRRFEILRTSRLYQGRHLRTRLHILVGEGISRMCYVGQVDFLGCKDMPWRLWTSG